MLLQVLRDDPNDEVAWLALADWLEESGQAGRAEARGGRVQPAVVGP